MKKPSITSLVPSPPYRPRTPCYPPPPRASPPRRCMHMYIILYYIILYIYIYARQVVGWTLLQVVVAVLIDNFTSASERE